MIKYKNFKFIIDVTYGALKFKKKIYIYYISRTKKNISIFAWRKIGELGAYFYQANQNLKSNETVKERILMHMGDSLKLSTSFLCLF